MPRNRMLKHEFWSSEQVVSCSHQARLLFIGFWNFADDHGVHQASYIRLKAEVFPIDPFAIDDIKKFVSELISVGLLREYVVDDVTYWIVTGWDKHQKINKPTYRHPLPRSELITVTNSNSTTGALLEHIGSTTVVLPESSNTSTEGVATNKKENKKENKKKDICEVETSPLSISENNQPESTTDNPHKTNIGDDSSDDSHVTDGVETGQQESPVLQVFSHWKTVMNHPKAKLDEKREKKIKKAIKLGFSVEELKQAILGCSKTPFNMGVNKDGQRYDGIRVILKDAEQIERFKNNAISPPIADIESKTTKTDVMEYWTHEQF